MSAFPKLAELLVRQAAIIGATQISVIDADWIAFAQQMADVAVPHDDTTEAVRVAGVTA